jgi:hypothetical protein
MRRNYVCCWKTYHHGNYDSLKANGSSLIQTWSRFTSICCPGSLLHVLIEIRLSSRTAQPSTLPFHLQKNHRALTNYGLLQFSPPSLKSLDYGTWSILQAKGSATVHQK